MKTKSKTTKPNIIRSSLDKWMKLVFRTNMFLLIIAVLFISGYALAKHYYEKTYKSRVDDIVENMSYSDFDLADSQTYYYSDGSLMFSYAPEQKEKLESVSDITDVLRETTCAAEDIRFYEHGAVDFKALARALYVDIKAGGEAKQGASTITQQLVKLTYLTNEKSIDRKVIEIAVSYAVEDKWTKDEILMAYLNKCYFGNGIYGIADASRYYFDKSYKSLTYNEAACLIAIVNSPSNLEPVDHFGKNQERKDAIMAILGRESSDVVLNVNESYSNKYNYDSASLDAINYVHNLVNAKNGEIIEVNTTIDKDLQNKIDELVDALEEPLEASVTVIDNKTGKRKI